MARVLDNWLATYAKHTDISEAPKAFHFWTGVSVIAGALRRRIWIDQKLFQWTPNFYIILVGPPGVATKSTAMKVGYKMLREVKGIHFGPQSMTWQGLLKAFKESTTGIIIEPEVDEVLAKRQYMSCLTCDVSELGTFLKPRDAEMTDFLIDMWDGQSGSWKRSLAIGESTTIENPWLNIIGCVTPSWLSNNFDSNMIFGGLTSRCIFVWGNEKTQLIPYPGDVIKEEEYYEREEMLIHDLREMSELFGEVKLTQEAKDWGRNWYEKHWHGDRPDHLASDRFSGYLARKQTHIHKLAMILSMSKSNELIVEKNDLEMANLAITSVERDMVIVFDSISDTHHTKYLDEILTLVRRNKTITKKTLWQHCIRLMDEEQFLSAIKAGVNAGYLNVRSTAGHITISVNKEVES